MGLYDKLRCEVPLPDTGEADDTTFQTRSFPAEYGARYTITREGRVLDSLDVDMEVDGYLEFYTSEGGWRRYRAFFRDGALKHIEAVNKDTAEGWYLGIARCRLSQAPSVLFK